MQTPVVAVILGSESDLPVIEGAIKTLDKLGLPYSLRILSAHRTPDAAREFARSAATKGYKVLIAVAGMAAHLAGALASETTLPVIGVPAAAGPLDGIDALFSTVQMPRGVPVATMAIGPAGATNAAIFAAEIIALSDPSLAERVAERRKKEAEAVLDADKRARKQGGAGRDAP